MIEFTGERVVPGQVDEDLWAEHMSRYTLAARIFAARDAKQVLDIGCGTGYGSALLARHGTDPSVKVTSVDVALDALLHAAHEFQLPQLRLVQASADTLPFRSESFDCITAFEVLEHLERWPQLLAEARRVLKPGGLFLVSTPNIDYYTASRGEQGPNPYHVHEFEFHEFEQALMQHFPHAQVLFQNHLGAIAFHTETSFSKFDVHVDRSRGGPATAHYYLGVCSTEPLPELHGFVFIPRASNVLRERELHIQSLQKQLAEMTASRQELSDRHQQLIRHHDEQKTHLEQQNLWARQLDRELHEAREKIGGLYREMDDLRAEFGSQLKDAIAKLDATNQELESRTVWAQDLDRQLRDLEARWNLVRSSRWFGLGRALGLGPKLEDPNTQGEGR